MRFRHGSKEQILKVANVLALVGMLFLALAIAAAIYVVAHALYASDVAALVAGAIGVATIVLWFAVPFLYKGAGSVQQDGRAVARPEGRAGGGPPR